MDENHNRKEKLSRQPYIVVWRSWREQKFDASHEGACASSEAEAMDEAQQLLDDGEHVIAAYNEGQCRRIWDTLVRMSRERAPGSAPFVVFYDPLMDTCGRYSRLDRVRESWIAVFASDRHEAIEIARERLGTIFVPFLSYDLDDMEEITRAVAGSWP